MANYFLNLKTFGRAGGSSAADAAAYRAGERIRDERTGRTYDYSDRQDVMHKEIVLPSRFADDDLAWAQDRASLWNTAERAESRSNARVAREYLVALPVELSPPQRLTLVRGFSQELSDRYGFAVDFGIHAPRDFPGSDPRNFHAHLLATTREATIEGLGAKTTLERSDNDRRALGLKPAIHELLHVRERWAAVTNEALREAHVAARIDHRTLEAQGIDREPRPQIPRPAFEMERRGFRNVLAERMRAQYEARVAARRERSAGRGNSAAVEGTGGVERAAVDAPVAAVGPAAAPAVKPQSLEDIRREAREDWLRYRQAQAQARAQSRGRTEAAPSAAVDRGLGDEQ